MRMWFSVTAPTEAYLIFKLLNHSNSGFLNIDEFYGMKWLFYINKCAHLKEQHFFSSDIYDASLYSWTVSKSDRDWFEVLPDPLKTGLGLLKRLVVNKYFEYGVCK